MDQIFSRPGAKRIFDYEKIVDAVNWAGEMHELKKSKSIKQIYEKMEGDIKKSALAANDPEPEPSKMTKWRVKKVKNFEFFCFR